jgi:hypothetical protein
MSRVTVRVHRERSGKAGIRPLSMILTISDSGISTRRPSLTRVILRDAAHIRTVTGLSPSLDAVSLIDRSLSPILMLIL